MRRAAALLALAGLWAPSAWAQVECPQQVWPLEARRYELEGTATVKYKVDETGRPYMAGIARSSGWAILDEASVFSLNKCSFPKLQAGELPGTIKVLQFVWVLDNPKEAAIRPAQLRASTCAGRQLHFTPGMDGQGVLVRFLVQPTGVPTGIKAEPNGETAEVLEKAVAFIASCTFTPAMQAGEARHGQLFGRVSQ